MARRGQAVPLTDFQRALLAELASGERAERYLAGGAALHFAPSSTRYSRDLDFFHDSVDLVASTFNTDRERLEQGGYTVTVELSQPGFVRATVSRGADATRVDWAQDSAWRFMPLVRDELGGLLLHPVDLAINKVLTLAGRDEARDFVDILFVHQRVLRLAALCWAAVGKDPGYTPLSLLELLKRRGRYRPEDFARLDLAEPFDLVAGKQVWLAALEEAEAFVRSRPPDEIGCLYFSEERGTFVMPAMDAGPSVAVKPHYGQPGGVLPQIPDRDLREELE
ncbi:MAG: nucleotidyl transferase AbiEii/AbiGii toxin family protein [Gemmatimonadales bacterium]